MALKFWFFSVCCYESWQELAIAEDDTSAKVPFSRVSVFISKQGFSHPFWMPGRELGNGNPRVVKLSREQRRNHLVIAERAKDQRF